MVSALVAFAAFFSFGYCVTDWFSNRQAAKRIDEMLRETIETRHYD
jgi:hypothetical protein